MLLRQI